MQRFFDVIFSVLAIIVLMPLLFPTAIILKFSGEGEVFFVQERVGKDGKIFGLFKFATMLKNSPNIGSGTITVKDDPRVLPFGKLLRKSKINELPQLFNILFGQMSVIGPRPLTLQTFAYYTESTQAVIKHVRPGLSGVQQVVTRDEEGIIDAKKDPKDFYAKVLAPYKGELEEWGVRNRSIGLYFLMIFMTVWIILAPRSPAIWKACKALPEPPDELKRALTYPM